MVKGLSHITFMTADLERMHTILTRVLDARQIYDSGRSSHSLSRERFYDIGGVWVAVMEGESLPSRSYNHVAFQIAEDDIALYRARIEALGLDLRPSRPRQTGEGQSLYFHDDDNHLFELHTGTLEERLRQYCRPND